MKSKISCWRFVRSFPMSMTGLYSWVRGWEANICSGTVARGQDGCKREPAQGYTPALTRADGGIGRRARLRAWSGITGWRFESSSAHRKALRSGAFRVLERPLAWPAPRAVATLVATSVGRPAARMRRLVLFAGGTARPGVEHPRQSAGLLEEESSPTLLLVVLSEHVGAAGVAPHSRETEHLAASGSVLRLEAHRHLRSPDHYDGLQPARIGLHLTTRRNGVGRYLADPAQLYRV